MTQSAPLDPPPSSRPGFTLQEDIWFGDFDDEQARAAAASSLSAMGGRIMGARPIPQAAQKLVQLTRDEDADVRKVVRVLEMDPGLSQKILRLVNSAGYGLRIRCTSLAHATALLGQTKLRQVATSAVLFDHFGKPSPLTRKKQEHGALVASLCRYLAIHLGLPQDDLFTIGLLHDIGQLMMLDDDLPGYESMLTAADGEFDTLHLRERELLGFDHAVLAGHVLASWSIPAPVPEVIALHHQAARAHHSGLDVAAMVQTLRFADHLSHCLEQKSLKQSITELAESEAASYLDFSEVQIAAMWRDLEKVQEITKNRRLNIIDVAPRSIDVPDSLRPRSVPLSVAARAERGPLSRRVEANESRGPASAEAGQERIAIPTYVSPASLLSVKASDVVGILHDRADNDPIHPENPPALAASPDPAPTPPTRALDPPAPLPTGASAPWGQASQADGLLRALPQAASHALEGAAFSLQQRPELREASVAQETPSAGAASRAEPSRIEPSRIEIGRPGPRGRMPEPEGTSEPRWFQKDAKDDVSPEVFPCAFCYAPTFGVTCPVCSAQVCAQHQFAAHQWCVACEEEFQEFLRLHPVHPVVPLSLAVTLGIGAASTAYFYSLDGALGALSIGTVLAFVGYVLNHARTKRAFRAARRAAMSEDEALPTADSFDAPRSREDDSAPSSDPVSETLEVIAKEETTTSEPERAHEPGPYSMPVPAPREEGFLIAPICDPPRPSLLNFRRSDESAARFDSLFARAEAEPAPAEGTLSGQDNRSAGGSMVEPLEAPRGEEAQVVSQETPNEPSAARVEETRAERGPEHLTVPTMPAPSASDGAAPRANAQAGAEHYPAWNDAAPETSASRRSSFPPDKERPSSVPPGSIAPLRDSLRTLPPMLAYDVEGNDDGTDARPPASREEAAPEAAIGFLAPVCDAVPARVRIRTGERPLSKIHCTGYPSGRVAIRGA